MTERSGGGVVVARNVDVTKYEYVVTWSEEDQEFVGGCIEFPSLSWLATTGEAALAGITELVDEVVADLVQNGEAVPEPLATRSYSGKFQMRVPPALHARLVREAAHQGLSLNALALMKLSAP